MIKKIFQEFWKPILGTTVGCLISAFGIDAFYHHSELISGGVTGIAMILNYRLGLNASVMNMLLNIPILILGWLKLGKKHVVLSFYGTLILSLGMELFSNVYIPYESKLTTVLLGGVICGFGSGIMLRSGGNSGGMDIVAKILHKSLSVNIGTIQMAVNILILCVYGALFNLDLAILTMATAMLSSYVNNYINDGIDRRRALHIITTKPDEMAKAIYEGLNRGVTAIKCEGGVTHIPHVMLYVVISRFELAHLKHIIKSVDPEAFFTIHVTTGVYGHGRSFHELSSIQD